MATHWLSDDEMHTWIAYVDMVALVADQLEQQLRRDSGLSHGSYNILARLSTSPERSMRLTELARGLSITRSRLSHALKALEATGLVERRQDPADKRGQVARLTDTGMDAVVRAAPGHVQAVRQAVFDPLTTADVKALRDISAKLVHSAISRADGSTDYIDLPWERR